MDERRTGRPSPLQNRVTPFGDLIPSGARGLFMGNRGCLHDESFEIRRWAATKGWIICQVSFKGRRRDLMSPGLYTELFFLDEATALAAGHRPCAECRRGAFTAYRDALARSVGADTLSAKEVDGILHTYRQNEPAERWALYSDIYKCPPGVFVHWDGKPWLWDGTSLLRWMPSGYQYRCAPPDRQVAVITPLPTIAVLSDGYEPVLHHTAAFVAGQREVNSEPLPNWDDIRVEPLRRPRSIPAPPLEVSPQEWAFLRTGGHWDEKWRAAVEGDTIAIWRGEAVFFARFERGEASRDLSGRQAWTMSIAEAWTEGDANWIQSEGTPEHFSAYLEWVLRFVILEQPHQQRRIAELERVIF